MEGSITAELFTVSTWIIPFLTAVIFHEISHGLVAYARGDKTAKLAGRFSLNPMKHIDTFGSIVFPIILVLLRSPFLFGWAKPVPVVYRNLGKPKRDMVLVAAAGPLMNLVLAFLAGFCLLSLPFIPSGIGQAWVAQNIANAIRINLVLMLFNLIPLPPLDGGKIMVGILPRKIAYPLAKLEHYGVFILFGTLFFLSWLSGVLDMNLNILGYYFGTLIPLISQMILSVVQEVATILMG